MKHILFISIIVYFLINTAFTAKKNLYEKYIDEVPVWQITVTNDALNKELIQQITAYLDLANGDTLLPVIIQRGIGGYLQCFGNPAEIAASLVDVGTLLPADLADRARKQAVALIKKYPPWKSCWNSTGADGAWNERAEDLKPIDPGIEKLPPGNIYFLWKVIYAAGEENYIKENWQEISKYFNTVSGLPLPVNISNDDLWHRPSASPPLTEISGKLCVGRIYPGTLKLSVPFEKDKKKQTEELTDNGKGKLNGSLGSTGTIDYKDGTYKISLIFPTDKKRIFYSCKSDGVIQYSDVAGQIAYARLAKMISAPEAESARQKAIQYLQLITEYGYNTMYQLSSRYYFINESHDGMYCPLHLLRSKKGQIAVSVLFADEIGRLLKDTEAKTIDSHVQAYINIAGARAWWQNHGIAGADTVNGRQIDVPGGDGFGGENNCMGPGIGWTFYMLKAYVTEASIDELEMWIDIPWAHTGDNMHWLRLAACMRAGGNMQWKPL